MKRILFMMLFIPLASFLFSVSISKDKTKFAYQYNGENRIGTIPPSIIDNTEALEAFIDILKLLELENEEKLLYLTKYTEVTKVNEEFVDHVDNAIEDNDLNIKDIQEDIAKIDTTPMYNKLVLAGGVGLAFNSTMNKYYYGSIMPLYYIIGDESSFIIGCDIRYTTNGLVSFGGLLSVSF